MAVSPLSGEQTRGVALGTVVLIFVLMIGACGPDASDSSPQSASLDRSAVPDSMTIPRVLDTDARFSTLRAALDTTGLDSLLASAGPYTLFAPPNEAFEALPPGTMETLLTERPDRLRAILVHHIVEGGLSLEGKNGPRAVTTMSGDTLAVRQTEAGVSIGSVPVVDHDVKAANGLIHVVDRVLPPPSAANVP